MRDRELLKKLPYPDDISNVKKKGITTSFHWRGTDYEITDAFLVSKVRSDGTRVGDNETILMEGLLKA